MSIVRTPNVDLFQRLVLYDSLGNPIKTVNSGQQVVTNKSSAGVENFQFSVQPPLVGGAMANAPFMGLTDGVDKADFSSFNGDSIAYTNVKIPVASFLHVYNAGNSDRLRNEADHTSGKGLQTFNSILGVKQFTFDKQAIIKGGTGIANPVSYLVDSVYTSGPIYADNGATNVALQADAQNNLKVQNITHIQAEIHESNVYRAGYVLDAVANGSAIEFVFTIPNGTTIHFIPSVQGEGEIEVYMYEIDTLEGGTALTPRNVDLTSGNSSGVTVVHTPTSYNVVDTIGHRRDGSGTTHFSTGMQGNLDSDEWIMSDKIYCIKIINRSGAAGWLQTYNHWIEE